MVAGGWRFHLCAGGARVKVFIPVSALGYILEPIGLVKLRTVMSVVMSVHECTSDFPAYMLSEAGSYVACKWRDPAVRQRVRSPAVVRCTRC